MVYKVTLGQQRERLTKGLVLVNTKLLVSEPIFYCGPMAVMTSWNLAKLDNRLGLKYLRPNYRLSFRYQEIHENSFCYAAYGKLGPLG